MAFSYNDDLLLVQHVEQNPFIYERRHKYYCQPVIKNACWEKIGATLGKKGEHCKRRWSYIKTCYQKHKRHSGSGASVWAAFGPSARPIWTHERIMAFLDKRPAKKERPIITVIAEGDSNARMSFPTVAEQASEEEPTASRRSQGEANAGTVDDDDTDLFLKQVAKKLSQLPPDKASEVKAKTFSLVAEMVSNALINQPVPGFSGAT